MVTSKVKRWLLAFVGAVYARLLPSGKKPIDPSSGRSTRSRDYGDDDPPVDFKPISDNRWGAARPGKVRLERGGTTLHLSVGDNDDDDDPGSQRPPAQLPDRRSYHLELLTPGPQRTDGTAGTGADQCAGQKRGERAGGSATCRSVVRSLYGLYRALALRLH